MTNNLGPATRDFNLFEFLLVISIAFGLSLLTSLVAIFSYRGDLPSGSFTDTHLLGVVIYELITAPIVFFILRHAQWRWAEFHFNYSNRGTLEGIALATFVLLPSWLIALAFGDQNFSSTATFPAILALSLVNPLFEELIVCAFVIEAMRKRFGVATAVNVSIAIRLTYHLYQGPQAFIVFAVFGLLFTIFYVRTGRLWPLVAAHALLDFVGLLSLDA